jgi:hypothetical protein
MLIIVTPEDARKDGTALPWAGTKLVRAPVVIRVADSVR